MEQYERLWQYQQVDMELDQYEKEMRGNSNRKELLKHRDFLLEQQNVLILPQTFVLFQNMALLNLSAPEGIVLQAENRHVIL